MPFVKCPDCSSEISTDAKNCPQCGVPNKQYKNVIESIVISFVALIIIVFVAVIISEKQKMSEKTDKEKLVKENILQPLPIEEVKKILKPFKKSVDKIEGITWYNMPYYNNMYQSRIHPYIGESNGKFWLRLKIVYHSNNWLFIQGFKFFGDGNTRELSMSGKRVERESGSTVWEWIDAQPDDEEINLLRLLGTSDDAVIRYIGRTYHQDRTLTSKEKKAIKTTVESYLKLVQRF
jgi:predicted nucleic acid-binding Zn ribbon protein